MHGRRSEVVCAQDSSSAGNVIQLSMPALIWQFSCDLHANCWCIHSSTEKPHLQALLCWQCVCAIATCDDVQAVCGCKRLLLYAKE